MQGLRTTIYKVGNLQEAKEWYTKAFQKAPYFDEPFYVGFNIGGYELGLDPEQEDKGEKASSVVAYWGVENIQEEYDRLLAIGAKAATSPMNVGGPIMVATVKDPWGNLIGIIHNPVFKVE